MFNNSNGYSLADIAAATGNGGNNGGFGFNSDGAWIILLFIVLLAGGNWGNGNGFGGGSGGGGNMMPYFFNTTNDVQRGFDQQALTSGIAGLQDGIYGLSTQLCNGFANAETAATARQMANMNQAFANQAAMTQGFNLLGSQLADCCCENRLGTADLKYTIATENCADRAAISDGIRDIIAAQTAGFQSIKDELYRDRLDEKDDTIAQLRQEVLFARGQASQIAQNQTIVDNIYNRLDTCPVGTTPVYGRTPIFTCNNGCGCNSGCGCGNNGTFFN